MLIINELNVIRPIVFNN